MRLSRAAIHTETLPFERTTVPRRHEHATPEAAWLTRNTDLAALRWAECHRTRTLGRVGALHQWPEREADFFFAF